MSAPLLPSGIPRTEAYEAILQTGLFREMEAFSNAFLARHADALADYARTWVADPLHQWSRQWEYPYAFRALADHLAARGAAAPALLDAGAGITFFPFWLRERLPGTQVFCCDRDASLEAAYATVNRGTPRPVRFTVAALEQTGLPEAAFDAICCISVLEHTAEPARVVAELDRLLKPGGLLVVTFDVSVDGRGDMPPAAAQRLLAELDTRFAGAGGLAAELPAQLRAPHLLTTRYARRLAPALLPWRRRPSLRAQLRSLVTTHRLIPFPPFDTVYCLHVAKRGP